MKIELLPGWGIDSSVLAPVLKELQAIFPTAEIRLQRFPQWPSANLDEALNCLEQQLTTDSWLIGWSLGGMLAVQLAARSPQRYKGVISLASNASFVAKTTWSAAMPVATFEAFKQGCASQLTATLKRFVMLCSQGSTELKQLRKQLIINADLSPEQAILGLEILAAIDNQHALQSPVAQLHLLANEDALVPNTALLAMQQISYCLAVQGSHAFILENPRVCVAKMAEFMQVNL